jgi:hypothetical protein
MITDNYLNFLEQNLNAHQYQVIMLGDFIMPNYGWINDVPHLNSHFYKNIKGSSIHIATCFLGPDQRNNSVINTALLFLVFSCTSNPSSPMVIPDKYRPPLLLDFKLTLDCHCTSLTPHHSYAQGDYLLLYNILYQSDWSCVLNENSVELAMCNLSSMVHEYMNLVIPHVRSKYYTFLHWFSNSCQSVSVQMKSPVLSLEVAQIFLPFS